MEDEGAERRKNFRVQDQVLLDYQVVSDAEMRGALKHIALVDSAELTSTTTLRRLETELQTMLSVLQKKDKELARCLDLLNNKINSLTTLIPEATRIDPALMQREVCDCSLSSSGIAFTCRESLPEGANIRLRMVILPNYHHIITYGEVIRVTEMDESVGGFSHVIGVKFVHILDRYREVLARRAMQREIEDLRIKRMDTEANSTQTAEAG